MEGGCWKEGEKERQETGMCVCLVDTLENHRAQEILL